MRWLYLMLCFFLIMHDTQANVYSNGINKSAWHVSASPTQCDIWQDIPQYGRAVFRTSAGEGAVFFLESTSSKFNAGAAHIESHLPTWYNDTQEVGVDKLGVVPIKRGKKPLWLASSWAELLLDKLRSGRDVIVAQNRWFDTTNKLSKVEVSPIGFTEKYSMYSACLAGLIQANFNQLRRTALFFSSGKADNLSLATQRKLDHILELAKHEKSIRTFYIDGHTDSIGSRTENLELSKRRAEKVSQYLISRGIPKDWLKVRWHGERYPTANNNSQKGRAKNRRVTIRLEKTDMAEPYNYASADTERAKSLSQPIQ